MRWRATAIYFLVLLLAGGTYLVIKTKQKEAAREEKESRRVFAFDAAAVKEIEIKSEGAEKICLEKGEKWKISRPIDSDVDRTVFDDFFSTLQNIVQERYIGKASDNLKAFGLDKPSLVVRVLTGDNWLELRMGGENPAETGRYATAGEGGDIFMVSHPTYEALKKTLRDFRRKELFSWQPDQVSAVEVKWRNAEGFSLERQGGSKQWKSANQPDIEIKARKVQDLLDELHWLRAVDFAAKDAMPSTPRLEIRLKLKDGQMPELKVADSDDTKKQAVAVSSEVEGPVLVASRILSSIPRSVDFLADRSLMAPEAADVSKITWKTENGGGNLVRLQGDSWGTREGEASARPVENSTAVKGFLVFLENVEYIEAVQPGSKPAEGTRDSVQLVDVFGKTSSLAWDGLPTETTDPVTVWIQRDGVVREVKVKRDVVKRLNESLARLGVTGKKN